MRLRADESAIVGRFFYSRKIGAGHFGTFSTISAITGLHAVQQTAPSLKHLVGNSVARITSDICCAIASAMLRTESGPTTRSWRAIAATLDRHQGGLLNRQHRIQK